MESGRLYYSLEELTDVRISAGHSESGALEMRQREVEMLTAAALRLRLPFLTRTTALYLLHRLRVSPLLKDTESLLARVSCLSLAMKTKETVKRLKDIHAACVFVERLSLTSLGKEKEEEIPSAPSPIRTDLTEFKDALLPIELMLQADTRFEEDYECPLRFLIRMVKEKKGPENLAKKAWRIVLDSYHTQVCIQFPPHAIAFAAIYLASRLIPKNDFSWELSQENLDFFQVQIDEIEEICMQVLDFYAKTLPIADNEETHGEYARLLEDVHKFRKRRTGGGVLSILNHRKAHRDRTAPRSPSNSPSMFALVEHNNTGMTDEAMDDKEDRPDDGQIHRREEDRGEDEKRRHHKDRDAHRRRSRDRHRREKSHRHERRRGSSRDRHKRRNSPLSRDTSRDRKSKRHFDKGAESDVPENRGQSWRDYRHSDKIGWGTKGQPDIWISSGRKRHRSKSRSHSRSLSKSRSRSRTEGRSRSRSRSVSRSRKRSRSRQRSHSGSRSRRVSRSASRARKHSHSRSASRSRKRSRSRSSGRSRSPVRARSKSRAGKMRRWSRSRSRDRYKVSSGRDRHHDGRNNTEWDTSQVSSGYRQDSRSGHNYR